MWVGRGGWIALAIPGAIVAGGLLLLGPAVTGELLLGLKSPVVANAPVLTSTIAWLVAVCGWLAVPTLVGAVTGYLVTVRLTAFRSRTTEQIVSDRGLDDE